MQGCRSQRGSAELPIRLSIALSGQNRLPLLAHSLGSKTVPCSGARTRRSQATNCGHPKATARELYARTPAPANPKTTAGRKRNGQNRINLADAISKSWAAFTHSALNRDG